MGCVAAGMAMLPGHLAICSTSFGTVFGSIRLANAGTEANPPLFDCRSFNSFHRGIRYGRASFLFRKTRADILSGGTLSRGVDLARVAAACGDGSRLVHIAPRGDNHLMTLVLTARDFWRLLEVVGLV